MFFLTLEPASEMVQAFSLTKQCLDDIFPVREKIVPTVRLCHPVVKQNQDNHLDHYR